MATIVTFIDDCTVKVVTKREEELLGHLAVAPARTDEAKQSVIDVVTHAFESSNNLAEASNYLTFAVNRLTFGMLFEYTVTPSEALRRRIGKRLRELREAKGMSVREFAFLIKMDPSNYSRIELGKHSPSVDTLNKIAFYLDAEILIMPRVDMEPRDNNHRVYSYE